MTATAETLSVLRSIRTAPPVDGAETGERCGMCGVEIDADHRHVVDVEQRSLQCACRGCALLFDSPGAGGRRFRAVPERVVALDGVGLTGFDAPVGLVFAFFNSDLDHPVAFYPGPAGATESLLAAADWDALAASHPALATIRPDVEAVLERTVGEHRECFLVPIDVCYELVGSMRRLWHGFDGGRDARDAVEALFEGLRSRAASGARHEHRSQR